MSLGTFLLFTDNGSDIVILTETWLSAEIGDEEVSSPQIGFNVYRRDRLSNKKAVYSLP